MSIKKVQPKKSVEKKVTVKKVEKKEPSEKKMKEEIAFKQLITFVPRITQYVIDGKNAKILNDKAIVYTKLLNLLYTSVSMMLKQNLNTYTNSLYINDILSPKLQDVRKLYNDKKNAVYAKVGGKAKYDYMIGKINKAIAELGDPTKIKNPTQEQKELLKMIEQNGKLRTQESITIDLKKELQTKRSNSLKQKHVIEIYQKAVLPIMNFLLKEPTINKKDLQDLDKLLKTYVKDGTLQLKDVNFGIKVKYGPKEEVFKNGKMFGYKGVIGNQFQEFLLQKEGKGSITIGSGKDYIEVFKENMIYEKDKLTNDKAKAPERQLFYPYFRSLVLSDHIKMQKLMKKFVEGVSLKMKNSHKVEKEVIKEIDNLVGRMKLGKLDLEIQRKEGKLLIKIDKNKNQKTVEVKKDSKK